MHSPEKLEIIHLQDSYTIMYALLSRSIMDELGEEGETIVREATRRYGKDRGRKRRKKHLDLNVKINMNSLFAVCSDLPSDPRFRRDRLLLTEEERNSHTLICPMAQVWEEYGAKKIGRIYCEEFHRACYQQYAYGLTQVNLARTLTEDGDDYCDFHVVLRKANVPTELKPQCFSEYDPDYKKPDVSGSPADGKSGFSSLCNRVYYYMLEVLLEQCPEQAIGIMTDALHIWAQDTAERLRQQAKELSQPLDISFADRHFPLYMNIDEDSLWLEYSNYGAKELLKQEFYNPLFEKLNLK